MKAPHKFAAGGTRVATSHARYGLYDWAEALSWPDAMQSRSALLKCSEPGPHHRNPKSMYMYMGCLAVEGIMRI